MTSQKISLSQSALSIREAVREDLEDIVLMLADDAIGSGREDSSLPLNQAYVSAYEAMERDENQIVLVGEDAGKVVGCLQVTFIPGLSRLGMWRGQIEGVRIARSHRNHGLGKILISKAIELCREKDCGLVQLTSDKSRMDAIRFYESLGFEASHEGMKLKLV